MQVEINARPLSIISEALGGANVDNCPHACVARPCGPLAKCIPNLENYECQCNPSNAQCNKAEELPSIEITNRIANNNNKSLPITQSTRPTIMTNFTNAQQNPNLIANDNEGGHGHDSHIYNGYEADRQQQTHLENMIADGTISPNDNDDDDDANDDDYNDDYYYESEYDKSSNENNENKNNEFKMPESTFSTTAATATTTATTTTGRTTTTATNHPSNKNQNTLNDDEHEMMVLNQKYTIWPYDNANANDEDTINELYGGVPATRGEDTIGGKYMSVDNDKLMRNDEPFKNPSFDSVVVVDDAKLYNTRNQKKNMRKLSAAKKYATSSLANDRISGKIAKSSRTIDDEREKFNFYSGEDIRTAKELIDDMERIMKNGDTIRLSDASRRKSKATQRKGHGACFTGVDSYFHYSDAETMRDVISYKIDLNLRFKTHSSNGLLLWTGRHSALKEDDFLSLGIENGYVLQRAHGDFMDI